MRREATIRTGRKDRPIIQLPSVALRAAVVVGVTVVLVGMILFRLWFLQILSGHVYVREANDNRLRSVKVVAPRGVILDRSGKVLVDNRAGLAIGIRPMDVPHGQLAGLIGRLAKVLHMSVADVRKELDLHRGYPYDLAVVKEDVSKKVVFFIREHQLSFPGVEVQQSYLRGYPYGSLAAHVLGYLGEILSDDLKLPRYRTYAPGDVIGVAGVEYTYDRWLRGRDGSLKIEVDAMGRPKTGSLPVGGRAAQPGDNLQLTIDAKVQQAAERALVAGIDLAHQGELGGERRRRGGPGRAYGRGAGSGQQPDLRPGHLGGWHQAQGQPGYRPRAPTRRCSIARSRRRKGSGLRSRRSMPSPASRRG